MVEHDFPLTMDELQKLTPDNLKNFSQEQLDQIYARLAAGPIPDGAFDGGLVFPKGESGDRRLAEIVGGLPGLAVELKLHRVEDLGHALWKGKVFYRNDRLLRNRIEDLALLKPIIEGDLSTIEKIKVDGKDQWLLFPAKLYCGQSLLDSRRESIIIDYFFTDEIPGLPPEARLPRRPQRARGARRDPHGAPRVLSRPRLRRQGVPAELHALQQGDRRARRPGLRAKRQGRRGLLAGHAGARGRRGQVTRWRAPVAMRAAPIVIACLVAAAAPLPAAAQHRPAPTWAVDPARAGGDLPPAGRSLFDFAVTRAADSAYDVPFPFERLVKHLEARAGCRQPCAKQVLIPLGRSLQRTSASPAFFEFPRVVAAIDVEAPEPGAPLLKDRIYLGYQETSDLVEVISYNEAAGRFEFQVVRDYREGGARQVVYARRAMCASCHQNQAPLFSRQVWEETNANPRVAAALARPGGNGGRSRADYHGVPIHRGVDVPNAIDAATDRANLLGAWQLLWRAGCGDGAAGARCRGAALVAALQYRLTDERAFDERSPAWRDEFAPALGRAWNARWPAGLAIPSPDIPNRDPLPPEGARPVTGLAAAHVPAAFEPLAPRAPLEVWTAPGPETARRLVAGLAGFVTAAESRALDRQLAARAERERPAERRHEAPCELAWTGASARFKCVGAGDAPLRVAGRLDLRGARVAGGEIGTIEVGGAPPIEHLEVAAGTFDARRRPRGVHRRYPHDAGAARRRSRDNRNQHGVESARGACPGCGARGLGACDRNRHRRLRAGAQRGRGARGGARRRRPARCAHFQPDARARAAIRAAGSPGERVVLRGRLASAAGRGRGARAADAGRRRRGALRSVLSALRELPCDRGALAAELPRRPAGARRGEREALRAAYLRAARAVARAAGDARQDADAAAAAVGARGRLRAAAGDRRARAHRVRARARRERRGAAAGDAARERVRAAPAVPARVKGEGE